MNDLSTLMICSHKMLTNQQDVILHGAQGETRTLTISLPADFESAASTIPPLGHDEKIYLH